MRLQLILLRRRISFYFERGAPRKQITGNPKRAVYMPVSAFTLRKQGGLQFWQDEFYTAARPRGTRIHVSAYIRHARQVVWAAILVLDNTLLLMVCL